MRPYNLVMITFDGGIPLLIGKQLWKRNLSPPFTFLPV